MPGAWIEQLEISVAFQSTDGSVKPDSALAKYGDVKLPKSFLLQAFSSNHKQIILEAGRKSGKSFHIAEDMKNLIDDAGFINTVEKVYKAPIGEWAEGTKMKELGNWSLLELEVGLEGFALALLTRIMGVSTL
jgi:hypothetical protein